MPRIVLYPCKIWERWSYIYTRSIRLSNHLRVEEQVQEKQWTETHTDLHWKFTHTYRKKEKASLYTHGCHCQFLTLVIVFSVLFLMLFSTSQNFTLDHPEGSSLLVPLPDRKLTQQPGNCSVADPGERHHCRSQTAASLQTPDSCSTADPRQSYSSRLTEHWAPGCALLLPGSKCDAAPGATLGGMLLTLEQVFCTIWGGIDLKA